VECARSRERHRQLECRSVKGWQQT
jgi:hypothetical protein